MNKKQLVAKLSGSLNLSKADAERTFDTITNTILDALKGDDSVKIAGFGTYKVAKRKARIGRNPRTGEQIQIGASQKVKFLPAKALKEIFNKYDVIVLPTTPTTAFELEAVNDPISMCLQDIYTVHANLSGNPAISSPIGNHSNGMPFGIQVIGDFFKEKEMLSFCRELEKINMDLWEEYFVLFLLLFLWAKLLLKITLGQMRIV